MIPHRIMEEFKFIYSGPLLYKSTLPKEDVSTLLKICNKNKRIAFNQNLVGVIEEEYLIKDMKSVTSILNKYMKNFFNVHKHWYGYALSSVQYKSIWTNFMKAGEYNPPHTHEDCNFSSVFFIDVPDEIAEEHEDMINKEKGTKPGQLVFQMSPEIPGFIAEHNHTPITGDFFLFPASLKHYVNPFKSKVTRISMAANMQMKV